MQTFISCNIKLYMFRASQRPSSGVPKTVSATSGIGHGIGTATSFHRDLIWNQATVEGSSGTNTMTYTRGSRYSFWNSWGWALWRPKHVEFDVAGNKCLHTDASSWSFLLTLNHDARNHEFKIHSTSDPACVAGLQLAGRFEPPSTLHMFIVAN
jgi:hypothetical protein